MNTPVISINQLTRCFKEKTAANQLSLEVHAGEIFGFLGHNGAGKTTTVRLLNGVIEPTSGSMRVPWTQSAGGWSSFTRPDWRVDRDPTNGRAPDSLGQPEHLCRPIWRAPGRGS